MKCRAYCTATNYELLPFFDSIKNRFESELHDEFLYIRLPEGDVLCFDYGSMVFWGCTDEVESEFLAAIKPYTKGPYDFVETDEFYYSLGPKPKVALDEITLPDLQKLTLIAISHGLAQSVKLGSFELIVYNTYERTRYIPEMLAKEGKIPLTRKQIRKQMGSLFLERAWINVHVDVLEIPEFFWDYPEIEPLYEMIALYLEIETRVEVLNQRLDVVHDLFEMLGTELNHQHSNRLEWAIILLIVLDVFLVIVHEIFKLV